MSKLYEAIRATSPMATAMHKPSFGLAVKTQRSSWSVFRRFSTASCERKAYVMNGQTTGTPTRMVRQNCSIEPGSRKILGKSDRNGYLEKLSTWLVRMQSMISMKVINMMMYPLLIYYGKLTIYRCFTHYKWSFSIAT